MKSLRDLAGLYDESEKHFTARVRRRAEILGWTVHHTLDSTGTRAGEPDLRMVRPPRYVLAELKSEHGRVTAAQREYLALLRQCPQLEVYVWRPSDEQEIWKTLT